MVNRSGRLKLCRVMTEICDKRISGDDFFDALVAIEPGSDSILESTVAWLLDAWDPEWPFPNRFDTDDPPYRIRRQMALFRRFLASESPYKWLEDAFYIDAYPTLRLWSTGLSISAAMLTFGYSGHDPRAVPFAAAFVMLAGWLLYRERHASQRDAERMKARASEHGNPHWWPFLNGQEFHAAGPSRSRINSLSLPPAKPGELV